MEMATVGKVQTTATIENLADKFEVSNDVRAAEDVRLVTVSDALVETGATYLSMPTRLIKQLGLFRLRTRRANTPAGIFEFGIYGPVNLIVQERECTIEVAEVPDTCPVLIGQVPLEILDFVIDPRRQKLIGNPAQGGEQMMDMF